jgi:hypothetical protein
MNLCCVIELDADERSLRERDNLIRKSGREIAAVASGTRQGRYRLHREACRNLLELG